MSSADAAVAPEEMARGGDGDEVRVEVVSATWEAEDFALFKDFLSTKRCCCLVPLSTGETVQGAVKKRAKWPESKRLLGAVAVSGGRVVGTVQGAGHGDPCDMMAPKEGEVYVEHLAVAAGQRGRGVGTKLLAWVENAARERGATRLSLDVLRGNPALRLYERVGFVKHVKDPGTEACHCCITTCLFGRPYGLCHPGWGTDLMHKPLS